MSAPFIAHEHGAWCDKEPDECPVFTLPPEMTHAEMVRALVFDMSEPAPESYVRQHRTTADCWCGPTLAPGTKFGALMHRKVEGE